MAEDKILVVEDEEIMRKVLVKLLTNEGHAVFEADNGEDALKIFQNDEIDVIIADIRLKRMDGLELLDRVKEIDHEVMVIMITAYASVESVQTALRKGAYDYITKPFLNDDIKQRVKNALKQKRLFKENRFLKRELKDKYSFKNIIGTSDSLQKVFELIDKVSKTNTNVLITGESGTGKELAARAVHFNSDRADRPFLAVNCGAIADSLLESELFGHLKGSFTGAIANKIGLFVQANEGTLLLDEIGEVSHALQVKLLRAIQEREVMPVGGTKQVQFNIRLIATTNKDLEAEIAKGNFREDLYYRINVVKIDMPSLRERRDDIPLLANHFIQKFAAEFGKGDLKLSGEFMKYLMAYNWPGNVRELENVMERAGALAEIGVVITPDHLPEKILTSRTPPREYKNDDSSLDVLERHHIMRILEKTGGHKVKTAQILGINLSTLYRKLTKYKLKI